MDQTPHNPTHIPAPPMNPEKRMPPVPPQPPADPQLRKNVTPEPSQTPDPKPLPPKPAPPADPPKKKKASPLPVILILLAVVAGGLFAGYSFLHIWSNGNCITPARCLICGKTYDSGLTHVWSEDTETQTAVCEICGKTVSLNQTVQILKQVDITLPVELSLDSSTNALTIRVPDNPKFAQDTVTLLDYTGEIVSAERYTISRTDDAVTIHLPDDLEYGMYTICSGLLKSQVVQIYYGMTDTFIPVEHDIWLNDLKMKSWKWDHYLCRIDGALATTAAEADATAFQNPWDFGSITLSNSSTSNKFVCDKLVSFDENGNMQEVYRFSCDGWMLVSSEDGKPGATQNLTDECYWIITSYR